MTQEAGTVAVTQIWRASRVPGGGASTASGRHSRRRRAAPRFWALLNAQALLNGTAGAQGGAGLIEDDRRRMAARRVS